MQAELKEKLTKMYDVRDTNNVFVFGFRTQVHMLSSKTSLTGTQWSSCFFKISPVRNLRDDGHVHRLMGVLLSCSLVAASPQALG